MKKMNFRNVSIAITIAISVNAAAQIAVADSIQTHGLNEVEVVAERHQVYSDVARVVTVISKVEINNAPVQTLSDLLRYVAGVDIRQRGANGVQTDVSVRGGSFDQVLILLNGVNITDPQTGHHNMNLPVDLSSIERIEVLQGPGSRVLGPNAFSGAINIVTGAGDKSGAYAQITGGKHGYISQEGNATIKKGKVTAFAAASNSRSEGYIADTDFDITNVFGQIKLDCKLLGKVNVQGGYQDKAFGAFGFYSLNPTYANEFEQTHTSFFSASSDKTIGKWNVNTKAYWRKHHDRFELFRDGVGAYPGYKHNYHQTDVMGAALNVARFSKLGKTTLGVDYRYEHIYSNKLGDSISAPIQVPFEPDSTYFYMGKGRRNVNFFLDQAIYLKRFSASAGILGNYSDDFGMNSYFGLDMAYRISKGFNVYATANQSLRLPTFTDLYYNSATQKGNPDLKPEQAMTYELGFKYRAGKFNAGLALYTRATSNAIDWVKYTSSDLKYEAVNYTDLNAMGTDCYAEYLPNKYVKRVKLSYSYLELDKQSDAFDSKYALDYLKHKLSMDFDHTIYKGLSAGWRFNYLERNGTYKNASNVTKNYVAFFLTDLRVQWTNNRITIFGEASNLFDIEYVDYGGVTQPGRWVKSGISVRL